MLFCQAEKHAAVTHGSPVELCFCSCLHLRYPHSTSFLGPGDLIQLSLEEQKQDDPVWTESGTLGAVNFLCFNGCHMYSSLSLLTSSQACPNTSLTTSWKPTPWDRGSFIFPLKINHYPPALPHVVHFVVLRYSLDLELSMLH